MNVDDDVAIRYICNWIIKPDVESGAFFYQPGSTGICELQERYEEPERWKVDFERVADFLDEWCERTRTTVSDDHLAWDRMMESSATMPTFQQVASRFGEQAAHMYRADMEALESSMDDEVAAIELPDDEHPPTLSATALADAVALASALAGSGGDRGAAVEAFNVKVAERRTAKRAKRQAVRERNADMEARAKSLGIWFPYQDQMHLWRDHERTCMYYPYFRQLIDMVRRKMRGERRMLQYSTRRRITSNTIDGLVKNMENMARYLGASC